MMYLGEMSGCRGRSSASDKVDEVFRIAVIEIFYLKRREYWIAFRIKASSV